MSVLYNYAKVDVLVNVGRELTGKYEDFPKDQLSYVSVCARRLSIIAAMKIQELEKQTSIKKELEQEEQETDQRIRNSILHSLDTSQRGVNKKKVN